MTDYLQAVTRAVRTATGCQPEHVETLPVTEIFHGKPVWEGDVEIFQLVGHIHAKRCYAWGYVENGELQTTVVLEIPPVDSARTAVRAAVAANLVDRGNPSDQAGNSPRNTL